jgi:hypothetical protein
MEDSCCSAACSCWCCNNVTSEEVKQFHEFAIQHAHIITIDEIVNQFLKEYPNSDTHDNIKEHLECHFLHPALHVAKTLRNLLRLSEDIKSIMVNRDTDDDSPLLDTRSVQMYLKVSSEISQMYKNADIKKMLYADTV